MWCERVGASMTPLTDFEKVLIAKVGAARFPPYTASKRFAQDLSSGHIVRLSDKGRSFLAYIAHRFRRQYRLSEDEQAWIKLWLVGWPGYRGVYAPLSDPERPDRWGSR
jgi:hypothetical protein